MKEQLTFYSAIICKHYKAVLSYTISKDIKNVFQLAIEPITYSGLISYCFP